MLLRAGPLKRVLVRSAEARSPAVLVEAVGISAVRPRVSTAMADCVRSFAAMMLGSPPEWNSGRVEGNVNRIKRIKRAGYGRAGFDLLRLQVLHAD